MGLPGAISGLLGKCQAGAGTGWYGLGVSWVGVRAEPCRWYGQGVRVVWVKVLICCCLGGTAGPPFWQVWSWVGAGRLPWLGLELCLP